MINAIGAIAMTAAPGEQVRIEAHRCRGGGEGDDRVGLDRVSFYAMLYGCSAEGSRWGRADRSVVHEFSISAGAGDGSLVVRRHCDLQTRVCSAEVVAAAETVHYKSPSGSGGGGRRLGLDFRATVSTSEDRAAIRPPGASPFADVESCLVAYDTAFHYKTWVLKFRVERRGPSVAGCEGDGALERHRMWLEYHGQPTRSMPRSAVHKLEGLLSSVPSSAPRPAARR